jgi:DNA-binding IclR family transcriptional regulator
MPRARPSAPPKPGHEATPPPPQGAAARQGRPQRGVQSVEVAGSLLKGLVTLGRPSPLKELALASGLAPAKAHPYLVSLGKVGLIEQDASSGHYGLGPLALELGLIGLQQVDPLRLCTARLPELAHKLGLTMALSIWSPRGPTVVRVEEAPTAVHATVRHGTVMNMRDTASGLLFAAHRQDPQLQALLDTQDAGPWGPSQWAQALSEVKAMGLAGSHHAAESGIEALAAPVFNGQGELCVALTALGARGAFDASLSGHTAQCLKQAAAELSAQLGWRQARTP